MNKLTKKQVESIFINRTMTVRELGRQHKVSYGLISLIRNRKHRVKDTKHLPDYYRPQHVRLGNCCFSRQLAQQAYDSNLPNHILADQLGCSERTIRRLKQGQTYTMIIRGGENAKN